HEGGCGTLHANSARDVPARVEALAMATGLPQAAVHSQLASALDAVVHVSRGPRGLRRVTEVAALERGADGLVTARPAVTFDEDGGSHEHPAAELLGRKLRR
ncbi:ATPase, T2SS/T4P/T4SS family, partial [Xanthomonas citri pv. citri]